MRRGDARAVERRLERVDAASCAGLVADLWVARGFEVDREGDVLVAKRGGDPVVVYPMAGSRLAVPAWPDRPVDVVVAPRGGWRARAVAARHGAQLVDAGDLLDLLRYAVDRATAAEICERHLGAPPGELRPPLRDRVGDERLAATGVGLALVVVAVGMTLAAAPVDLPGEATDPVTATRSPAPPVTESETPVARTARPRNVTELAPGVSTRGIENLSALRDAHAREVRNRSYTLHLSVYQPYGGTANVTPLRVETDIAVEGNRYLIRTVMTVGGDRTLIKDVYYDGEGWYSRQLALIPVDRLIVSEPVSESPWELRRSLVGTYLDTPETAVIRSNREDDRYHRVIGHGPPPGFGPAEGEVRHYTVVAFVSERGVVNRGTVEYSVTTEDGRYDGRFRWDYDRIGETTVDQPPWYRESAINGTGNVSVRSPGDRNRTRTDRPRT